MYKVAPDEAACYLMTNLQWCHSDQRTAFEKAYITHNAA